MKRIIELDDFIDALIETRDNMKVAAQWDTKLTALQAQEAALKASITALQKEKQDVTTAAQRDHATTLAGLSEKLASATQDYTRKKAQLDADLSSRQGAITSLIATHAQTLDRIAHEEAEACTQREAVKGELDALKAALEEQRQQADKLSRFVKAGRA